MNNPQKTLYIHIIFMFYTFTFLPWFPSPLGSTSFFFQIVMEAMG